MFEWIFKNDLTYAFFLRISKYVTPTRKACLVSHKTYGSDTNDTLSSDRYRRHVWDICGVTWKRKNYLTDSSQILLCYYIQQ